MFQSMIQNKPAVIYIIFGCFFATILVSASATASSAYTEALQRSLEIVSSNAVSQASDASRNSTMELIRSLAIFSKLSQPQTPQGSAKYVLDELQAAMSVSQKCGQDLRRLGEALLRLKGWALPFVDSTGRPQPGLLIGANTWLGSFDQCLSAEAEFSGDNRTDSEPFSGSYCLLALQSQSPELKLTTLITIGTCWPDSCSMLDVLNATSALLSLVQSSDGKLRVGPAATECRSKAAAAADQLSAGAIAMLAILGTIGLCVLFGTSIDIFQRSRSRSAAAAVTSVPVQATAVSALSSAAASSAAASSIPAAVDEDENFDSSETAGNEEALIAATVISCDNRGAGRYRCLGILKSILLCFSLRTNAAKLLDQRQARSSLRCVNGIRFISMSWVILGHTYIISLINASNLALVAPQWLNEWTFQAVLNATVAVDTFFVLSGLLATYLFLREADRRRGQLKRINWLKFYLHRYWRLTAPYMLILGAYTTLAQYMYDGPRYPRNGFDENCRTTWWHNLLYINNLFSMTDMCMPWTWYLANDMQFYFISPLFLTLMAKRPALGVGAAALGIVASTVGVGVQSTLAGLGVSGLDASKAALDSIYIRPWFRIGPYLVGSLAGLAAHRLLSTTMDDNGFEHRRRRGSLRLHWTLRLLGWATAAALCLSVLYGLFDVERGLVKLSQPVTSLYNATFRLAWSLGVAWVVLACITGNGGLISDFLSAGAFAPLSRLSYCAYLLHPIIMTAVETARRDTFQWNSWTPIGNFFTYLVAAYTAAVGASLALESPLIALERLTLE